MVGLGAPYTVTYLVPESIVGESRGPLSDPFLTLKEGDQPQPVQLSTGN